jgi:hypothetical protein
MVGDMAGIVNLVTAFCTADVVNARAAAERDEEATANSLEAGRTRLRDADMARVNQR